MVSLLLVLLVLGVALWAINSFVPMDGKIRGLVNVVIVVLALLYVLSAFGLLSGGPPVPNLRRA